MNNDNGRIWYVLGIDNTQLQANAQKSLSILRGIGTGAVDEGNKIDATFKKIAASVAAFFTVQQGSQLVKSIARVRGEFQQLDIALSTMLQSREKAGVLMNEVVALAAKTPFGLKDAAAGVKQLLAYGSTAETVINELRMIGDVASGVSVPIKDLVYLYGTLKTQGRAYAVDIRQFAGRGIPIYAELAKVLGVAKDKVSELVEAGKVGFPEVEKAFKNMTSEGGMFFNLMEQQSTSLTGRIERLKDSIDVMFNEIGKSNEGLFNGAIDGAAYLLEHYKEIAKITGILVSTYGAYKVAVALVTFTEAQRTKTLATHSALLGQEVRNELLATQLIRDKAVALQQEAVVRAMATKATYQALQAEVSILAAKRRSLTIAALEKRRIVEAAAGNLYLAEQELAALGANSTAQQVNAAQRKVNTAAKRLDIATSEANIATENALTASRDFNTKKTELQTTAVAVNTTVKKAGVATNEAMIATENAATLSSTRLTMAQHFQALSARLAAGAQALLSATMLNNPYVATIAIVGGLVASYFLLRDTTTSAERVTKAYNDVLEKNKESLDGIKNKSSELTGVINNEAETRQTQMLAFRELQNLYPDRLKFLTLESFKLQDVTAQQKMLNEEIDKFRIGDLETRLKAVKEIIANNGKIEEGQWDNFKETISDVITMEDSQAKRKEDAIGLEKKITAELAVQREYAKTSVMKEAERLAYYQQQLNPIQKLVDQFEASNGKLERNYDGTIKLGDALSDLGIFPLLEQFNSLQRKIRDTLKLLNPGDGKRDKAYFESEKDKLELELKNIDKRDKDAEKKRADILKRYQPVKEALDFFNLNDPAGKKAAKAAEADAKKAEKERERLKKSRAKFLTELGLEEEKYTNKTAYEGSKQLADLKDKYAKMEEEAIKQGFSKIKDPGVFQRIENLEKNETGGLTYDKSTKTLLESLDRQKQIYADYEAYKTEVGKEEADKRFKNEYKNFDPSKSLKSILEAERDKIGVAATSAQQERLLEINKQLADINKNAFDKQTAWLPKALSDYGTYEQKKLNLTKRFEEERRQAIEAGRSDLLAGINKAEQQELKALQASNSEKIASMEQFAAGAVYLTRKAAKQQIEILQNILKSGDLSGEVTKNIQKKIDTLQGLLKKPERNLVSSQLDSEIKKKQAAINALAASGDTASDAFKGLNNELMDLQQQKAEKSITAISNALELVSKLAPALNELSAALNETDNNTAKQIGGVFASLANGATNLLKTFEDIKKNGVSTIDAIGAAANFVISTIANIISSAQAQKKAYEEFYLQNLAYQHNYNNALIEEIRLREGIKDTVFFNDYAGKIKAGLAAEIKAVNDYNEALVKLQDAQVITGTKKVRDWAAVASSTLSGATAGAIVGVNAAGVGAIPGAAIGAAVGFIGGMLRKRTVVNIYDGLMKQYPKLIDEQGNLNKAMAEAIISSGKIEGSSKENLQYLISMNEQYEKAKEQIEGVISDLAGSLGSDLMSSLFDDWANGGENVGKAFTDGVSKSLANIGKNLLFNTVFGDDFVALQERIKQGFKTSGDPNAMVTSLLDFTKEAQAKGLQYQSLLSEYAKQLKDQGINDVFGLIKDEVARTGASKGIASISQDSANELNGRFTIIQGHTFQMNESLKLMMPLTAYAAEIKDSIAFLRERSAQALIHLSNIDTNTRRLEAIEGDMRAVSADMRSVKTGIDDINLKGIKLKTI